MDNENTNTDAPAQSVQDAPAASPKKSGPNLGMVIVITLIVIGLVVFFSVQK